MGKTTKQAEVDLDNDGPPTPSRSPRRRRSPARHRVCGRAESPATKGNYLNGYVGDDLINGGDGNDTLVGQFGNDTLNGGKGDDILITDYGDDTSTVDGGSDIVDGGDGNDPCRTRRSPSPARPWT